MLLLHGPLSPRHVHSAPNSLTSSPSSILSPCLSFVFVMSLLCTCVCEAEWMWVSPFSLLCTMPHGSLGRCARGARTRLVVFALSKIPTRSCVYVRTRKLRVLCGREIGNFVFFFRKRARESWFFSPFFFCRGVIDETENVGDEVRGRVFPRRRRELQ